VTADQRSLTRQPVRAARQEFVNLQSWAPVTPVASGR
jgi:hypothetical protein